MGFSNEAKNASDNAEMMVHVDESFNFHTSRNSYVNFDLISLPGLSLRTETNDIPENLKKIIRVKASRPLVESNFEHSWIQYLVSMSCQGTWADSIIIQAVADVFNLKIILISLNHTQILLICILCGRSDCCSCRGTMCYFY